MDTLQHIHAGADLAPKVEPDDRAVNLAAIPQLPHVKHEDVDREPAQDRAAAQHDRNTPERQAMPQANIQRPRNHDRVRSRNWNRTGARGPPRNIPNASRNHGEPTVSVRRDWHGRRLRIKARYIAATGDLELRPRPSSYSFSFSQLLDVTHEVCAKFHRVGVEARPRGVTSADLVARSYRAGPDQSLIILPRTEISRSRLMPQAQMPQVQTPQVQTPQVQNEMNSLTGQLRQLGVGLGLAIQNGRSQDADAIRAAMADVQGRMDRHQSSMDSTNRR